VELLDISIQIAIERDFSDLQIADETRIRKRPSTSNANYNESSLDLGEFESFAHQFDNDISISLPQRIKP